MITIETARQILGKTASTLSDKEIEALITILYRVANISVERAMRKNVENIGKVEYNDE